MKITLKTYRWKNVHEWLAWAVHNQNISSQDLLNLVMTLDSDTIQDYFESDMDQDGYFDLELND